MIEPSSVDSFLSRDFNKDEVLVIKNLGLIFCRSLYINKYSYKHNEKNKSLLENLFNRKFSLVDTEINIIREKCGYNFFDYLFNISNEDVNFLELHYILFNKSFQFEKIKLSEYIFCISFNYMKTLNMVISKCSNILYNLTDIKIIGCNVTGKLGSFNSNLKSLNLSNNFIEGPIPKEFENYLNLEKLILSNNKLSGKIPIRLFNSTSKLIKVDLNYNKKLYGNVSKITSVKNINFVKFSNTSLSGKISRKGVIDIKDTLLYLNIHNTKINLEDMTKYLSNEKIIIIYNDINEEELEYEYKPLYQLIDDKISENNGKIVTLIRNIEKL